MARVDKELLKELANDVEAMDQRENIGQLVKKKSNKPFKSQMRIATIKDVILHPKTKSPAYLFEEDESYVECHKCEILKS